MTSSASRSLRCCTCWRRTTMDGKKEKLFLWCDWDWWLRRSRQVRAGNVPRDHQQGVGGGKAVGKGGGWEGKGEGGGWGFGRGGCSVDWDKVRFFMFCAWGEHAVITTWLSGWGSFINGAITRGRRGAARVAMHLGVTLYRNKLTRNFIDDDKWEKGKVGGGGGWRGRGWVAGCLA